MLIALCRPVNESAFATPATNQEIAEEIFLSVDAVKAQLRVLFDRFGLEDLPQNQKRARLAASTLVGGLCHRATSEPRVLAAAQQHRDEHEREHRGVLDLRRVLVRDDPAHSRPIATKVGTNIAALISHTGCQPCPW